MPGNDILFEDKLQSIGDRLEQAKRTHSIRTDAILHVGRDLALDQDQVRARAQDGHEDGTDRQERGQQVEFVHNGQHFFIK